MTRDERTEGGEHLDLLRLDAVRAGEGSAGERQHLKGCARCQEELEAIERIARAVTGLRLPAPEVPARVEEAILAEFGRLRPKAKVIRFPAWRWVGPAVGFAVAAGLAWLSLTTPPRLPPPPAEPLPLAAAPAGGKAKASLPSLLGADRAAVPQPLAAKGEAKALRDTGLAERPAAPRARGRAGPVNILDAYRLALALEKGRPVGSTWDENGDGTVDRKDVEALAALAVAL